MAPAAVGWRRSALIADGRGGRIVAFGVVAVAGTQLCYFAAVERLPVGIALLIEYLGPVLLVGLHLDPRRGVRPPR